jgi:hypothetical protein
MSPSRDWKLRRLSTRRRTHERSLEAIGVRHVFGFYPRLTGVSHGKAWEAVLAVTAK